MAQSIRKTTISRHTPGSPQHGQPAGVSNGKGAGEASTVITRRQRPSRCPAIPLRSKCSTKCGPTGKRLANVPDNLHYRFYPIAAPTTSS
jgi:hypothetical protein